jgi:hypothetical protein
MRNKTLLAAAAARLIFGTPALCVAQGAQDSAPAPHVAKDRRSPARATPPLPPVWLAPGGCDIRPPGSVARVA